MKLNYYVTTIKQLSNDTIEKTITLYDDNDTALRKFHEAFNVIGGGPKRITAMLLQDVENVGTNSIDTMIIKNETWTATPEETPAE